MAITITSGDRQVKGPTFDSVENLTQSTATARRAISVHVPVTTLSGGTATGIGVDLYTVASSAVEGQEKWIQMLATGEAKVVFESIATGRLPVSTGFQASATVFDNAYVSATGAFVLTTPAQFLFAKYVNTRWWILGGMATFATAS